jgi:hypothetical protein
MTSAPTTAHEQLPAPASESGTRKFLTIFASLIWDIGLAMGAYYALRALGSGEHLALLAGAVVAGLRMAYVALRTRSFDAFAGFILISYLLGLPLALMSGDDRFLVIKDSLHTAIAGLIFLATCFVGRPAIFYAARRFSATTREQNAWWDSMWKSTPGFRRVFYLMTAVWAVGLLVEAAIRIVLAYVLPLDVMVALSGVLAIATLALLLMWTVWFSGRARRRRLQA